MGEGEGGMIWENGIDIRIISYIERVSSPGSMHDTGCLGLVHWDDPEDGMGREEGGGFRMGNTCIPVADSFRCWQNQYNTVKFKNKIKLKKIYSRSKKKKRTCYQPGGHGSEKIPHAAKPLNPWVTTTQSVLQSLGTVTTELGCCRY